MRRLLDLAMAIVALSVVSLAFVALMNNGYGWAVLLFLLVTPFAYARYQRVMDELRRYRVQEYEDRELGLYERFQKERAAAKDGYFQREEKRAAKKQTKKR